MIAFDRVLTIATTLAATAVGLAGPAAADPLQGAYKSVVTDISAPTESLEVGAALNFFLQPCGPDCTKLVAQQFGAELHLQGDAWNGVGPGNCGLSLSGNAATLTLDCPGEFVAHYAVTKVA